MEQATNLWNVQDIDALFPEHGEIVTTPWPTAGRRKDRQDYDKALVREALEAPFSETAADIDPRDLKATQPMVTRAGVEHYMTTQADEATYADTTNPGNEYPVVYVRRNEYRVADWQPAEEYILLSGHHRAAAALLQGRTLKARRIDGGYGPSR